MAHTRVEEIKEKYTFALARMQTTFDRKSAFFDIDDVEWLIKEVEALRRAEMAWAEKFRKMVQLTAELEEYLSDVRFRLSKILYHITDGSFSQPTYPADLMISWIDDAFMRTVDRETKVLKARLTQAEEEAKCMEITLRGELAIRCKIEASIREDFEKAQKEIDSLWERLAKADKEAGYEGYYSQRSIKFEEMVCAAFNLLDTGWDPPSGKERDSQLVKKAREIRAQMLKDGETIAVQHAVNVKLHKRIAETKRLALLVDAAFGPNPKKVWDAARENLKEIYDPLKSPIDNG